MSLIVTVTRFCPFQRRQLKDTRCIAQPKPHPPVPELSKSTRECGQIMTDFYWDLVERKPFAKSSLDMTFAFPRLDMISSIEGI